MEGVVKFNCHWNQTGPVISDDQYETINYWREILYNMDLIGVYENGVGFGNISMRIKGGNQFIITASATGEIPELEPEHYVKVISFNIDDNAVQCTGPLKASSESLTHAAIYLADPGLMQWYMFIIWISGMILYTMCPQPIHQWIMVPWDWLKIYSGSSAIPMSSRKGSLLWPVTEPAY